MYYGEGLKLPSPKSLFVFTPDLHNCYISARAKYLSEKDQLLAAYM